MEAMQLETTVAPRQSGAGTAPACNPESHPTHCLLPRAPIQLTQMCTTAQALQKWEAAISLLDEVKAHTAAHPQHPDATSPEAAQLVVQLGLCLAPFQLGQLSSPHSTWEMLLQKQVGTASAVEDSVPKSRLHTLFVGPQRLCMPLGPRPRLRAQPGLG